MRGDERLACAISNDEEGKLNERFGITCTPMLKRLTPILRKSFSFVVSIDCPFFKKNSFVKTTHTLSLLNSQITKARLRTSLCSLLSQLSYHLWDRTGSTVGLASIVISKSDASVQLLRMNASTCSSAAGCK